ncbi:MAG: thioredoxin [Anaerolineaceae bacterium]|nr:thioredoxin [Anaerolineaceae bacterium]
MPVFNTPINTDDNNLAKVLGQSLPIALYLYDNRLGANKSLDEAITKAAKDYAGQLLVVRVDASANPQAQRDYGNLSTPALVTLSKENGSRTVKSKVSTVNASDVQAHIAYLLGKGPAPKQPTSSADASTNTSTASSNGSSTKPQVVTDATFDSEVLKSKVPVLVDFWAPWCGPCQTIAPTVEQMAQKYAGRAKVVKVNVDDNPRIAQQFQVMSIPTLMTFKNGSALKRQVGANPTIIPSMIEEALR